MKAIFSLAALIPVLMICDQATEGSDKPLLTTTASIPPGRPAPLDASEPAAVRRVFDRQLTVFGLHVLATKRTPTSKLQHAAAILAGYLDNDLNGKPDNPRVAKALLKQRATLVMFATEREAGRLERILPDSWQDSRITIGLFGEETQPDGVKRRRFDASYEEIFHMITHAGYAAAYPEVFGMKPGSQLANAMDKARGGRFLRVPRRYPRGAWYTYDDRSCDYGCQTQEYIYWGMTSLLGAQAPAWRYQEIRREWRLNTPEKFQAGDPALYKLLTDPRYHFPTRLPDGRYRVKATPR